MEASSSNDILISPQSIARQSRLQLVVVGHVDHGKSTIVGRLLAETNSLAAGKLEEVKDQCERSGKRFEYAFLIDALADERAQGITIDRARVFFQSAKRHYLLIDAPGHIEFLRNMITGASHADLAVLVIDALEGVQENSRRHGHLVALLGVRQVVVVVNKMDLVGYDKEVFSSIVSEYETFLRSLDVQALHYIPVSGINGDSITTRSERMPWYGSDTLLEALDNCTAIGSATEGPFRMFVQDVYKFTKFGDERRIVAGTVHSGKVAVGNRVTFYPSGKTGVVKSLEAFPANSRPSGAGTAGMAVGFTLAEQIYVQRGELAVLQSERQPEVSSRFLATVFWLGKQPFSQGQQYLLRLGTAKVEAEVTRILSVIDAAQPELTGVPEAVTRNAVAECELRLRSAVAFDTAFQTGEQNPESSRFVLIDSYQILGGGIIRQALVDSTASVRGQAVERERRWISSGVAQEDRVLRYGQQPKLILITGPRTSNRKGLGRAVERALFAQGRVVSFQAIGNLLYGLDRDLVGKENVGDEHIRRLAELANFMIQAGLLFIVSAAELSQRDLELLKALCGVDNVVVFLYLDSDLPPTVPQLEVDLLVSDPSLELACETITQHLWTTGICS